MVVALLTAAGIGSRMGQEIPKQFMFVEDKPIIIHTMEAFQNNPNIDAIMVITLPAWKEVVRAYSKQFNISKLRWIVNGGKTGQESIYNGLTVLKEEVSKDDIIMIHDGNRCFVSQSVISNNLAVFHDHGSAVAAIPCVEAVFRSSDNGISSNIEIPREQLYRTQTPHTYTLKKLLWAHEEAKQRNISCSIATCSLMTMLGEPIYFSKGSEENLKITTVEDLAIFKALLQTKKIIFK